MIDEIARAFHCPQGLIAHLARHHHESFQSLDNLGPMRVYWKEDKGWMLYNRPINIAYLENIDAVG